MPKVLLVEETTALAERIGHFLQQKGLETDIAPDGMSALRQFAESDYDILLVDRQLPLMNGVDLCKRIRTTTKGQGVPLIMMSMSAQDPAEIEQLKKGLKLSGFLTKPFSAEMLTSLIASSLPVRAGTLDAPPRQGIAKPQPQLQGDFGKTPFEKVLLYFMARKVTGVLTLTGEEKKRFYFISGAPVELDELSEQNSFGRYLAEKKLVDAVELREYEARRGKGEEDPRDLFVKMGCLTPQRFLEENRCFLHDRLTGCFSLRAGAFVFDWRQSFVQTLPAAGVSLPALFYRGFKTHLSPAKISAFMQEKGNLYPGRTAAFFEYQNHLAPEIAGAELLDRLDGTKTSFELMDNLDPDESAALLYTLDHLKALSFHPALNKPGPAPPFFIRERVLKPAAGEAEKFEDMGGELSDLAAELGPFGEMTGGRAAAAGAEGLAPLEEELKKQWEAIKDKNYYEIFGMKANTFSFDKLKKAYFDFTRAFAPDKFFASSGDIMHLAEEFLSKISNAYETLTNVVSKENYDELLSSQEQAPAGEEDKEFYEQIQFQSGKVFIEQGQYDSAEKAFENCMLIDAKKSDYYAYLALALYHNPANKGNPAAIKRAKDLVNKSLQLGRLSVAHALKGTMLLDEGGLNFAEAEFNKALKLNLNNKTAQKGLESIREKREKDKKGIFGRIFK